MRASLLFFFALVAIHGCKRSVPDEKKGSAPVGVERLSELETRALSWLSASTELPPRADVVALSDQLAVGATRLGPVAWALRLSRRSAELRTRLWRVGHTDADAREAIEIYASTVKSALAEGNADEGCQAAFAHAVLASEHAHDPALLYRQLYSSARLFAGAACESQFSEALSVIAAYRPAKDVLATLDQETDARRAKTAPAAAPTASPGGVSTDDAGVVVTPSVANGGGVVMVFDIEPYG